MVETQAQREMREHWPVPTLVHQFFLFLRDNPDIHALYADKDRDATLAITRAFQAGWYAAREQTNE